MKKIIILLLVSVLFGNNSCNISEAESMAVREEVKIAQPKPDPLKTLLASEGKIFVNVVNSGLCFRCFPVFMYAAEHFQNEADNKNIVYVFPSMRSGLQADFLKENFNLDPQKIQAVFDDEIYKHLQQKYGLNGTSDLLCFENQQLIGMVAYQRTNVDEIIRFVDNI
ncbi:MAG: hypothetical protein GX437_03995 [Sphingobacteriales bacterium]|nr:hypothetical protein [Sphingobacteriales bacterium]